MIFKDIIKTLKINHYIKNIVVFVPLLFSINFFNIKLCLNTLIIFIAFCLISSAVYILNDIIDIKNDKIHPIKKNRPIASGKITINQAIFILAILLITSCFIAYQINTVSFFIILSYFILNIFYSIKLKNIPLVSATCIAIGFILRILSGCASINVAPSPLVVLMTFFLSCFFTFSKRKLELELIKENSIRQSLKEIDIETIKQFILINAVLSISFYITYVLDDTAIQRANTQYLYVTVIPFTLIIYRLFLLVNSKKITDDPIVYIEQDKILKWLFLFYFVVFAIVLANN